jgi:hypothetical protein
MTRVRARVRGGIYISEAGRVGGGSCLGMRGRHPRWRTWPHDHHFPRRWCAGEGGEEKRD